MTVCDQKWSDDKAEQSFVRDTKKKKRWIAKNACVRRVWRLHPNLKFVHPRGEFLNEKFVILERKLDDEGFYALPVGFFDWLAVDFS